MPKKKNEMLHHLSMPARDLKRSAAFYDPVMKALGYKRVFTNRHVIGYGLYDGQDQFALRLKPREAKMTGPGFHLAFAAPSRKAVDAFYKAAMKHGAKDNGGSGLNPEYGKNYYAAFVFDPDGYRIEAVINRPV